MHMDYAALINYVKSDDFFQSTEVLRSDLQFVSPSNTLRSLSPTEYGTVLELRINSGGKLPNFGFVVFDDAEPVQKILSNRVT